MDTSIIVPKTDGSVHYPNQYFEISQRQVGQTLTRYNVDSQSDLLLTNQPWLSLSDRSTFHPSEDKVNECDALDI